MQRIDVSIRLIVIITTVLLILHISCQENAGDNGQDSVSDEVPQTEELIMERVISWSDSIQQQNLSTLMNHFSEGVNSECVDLDWDFRQISEDYGTLFRTDPEIVLTINEEDVEIFSRDENCILARCDVRWDMSWEDGTFMNATYKNDLLWEKLDGRWVITEFRENQEDFNASYPKASIQVSSWRDHPFGNIWVSAQSRQLTRGDIQGLTSCELNIIRNGIYAIHGRPFVNTTIQDYYISQPWYSINENFRDSMLNSYESANTVWLREREEELGMCWVSR